MLDVLRNPTTIKLLATQINLACDYYISKKISEKQLKELVFHYANKHGKKLFDANGINPTIQNRIGKKRIELLELMLEGLQLTIV